MKIISEELVRSLCISPKQCMDWIMESFAIKQDAQLPAKISVHPAENDFFTSMPCLLPHPVCGGNVVDNGIQYFGIKEVHRIDQYLLKVI